MDGATVKARDLAEGRWRGILPALGVSANLLCGKHLPCPMCGGKDRFRFDDKGHGRWICSHCGAGDGYQLLEGVLRVPFREVVRRVREVVGSVDRDKPKPERSTEEIKRQLNSVWQASELIKEGDPAWRYLNARCGIVLPPKGLRIHPALAADRGGSPFPTLIARITGPDGRPSTLHRTFLTPEGMKAPIDAPRKLMPGPVVRGAAIRLTQPEEHIGIAEGIETAISAGILHKLPCWAAIDAGRLSAFEPPAGTRRVTIFGDADKSFTGQLAAFTLARRLTDAGLGVDVRIPDTLGQDWNDVYAATREGRA